MHTNTQRWPKQNLPLATNHLDPDTIYFFLFYDSLGHRFADAAAVERNDFGDIYFHLFLAQ